jgi:hypothetical protein
MFTKFISTLIELFTTRGGAESFKTDDEIIVYLLDALAGLVAAEPTVEPIITTAELEQMRSAYQGFIDSTADREEQTCKSLRSILDRCRLLKGFTAHGDLPVGFSDELWHSVDLLQADGEIALDRLDPEELSNWLASRW